VKGLKWPLWIGVALCAAVVGWMGAVAYYHFQVRSLLRTLRADAETTLVPTVGKPSRILDHMMDLEAQGCRALPLIVEEFHPEAPSEYLDVLSTALRDIVSRCLEHEPDEAKHKQFRTLRAFEVNGGDPPAELRRKCDGLHRWWTTEGYRYHQSLRFWTTACPVR